MTGWQESDIKRIEPDLSIRLFVRPSASQFSQFRAKLRKEDVHRHSHKTFVQQGLEQVLDALRGLFLPLDLPALRSFSEVGLLGFPPEADRR